MRWKLTIYTAWGGDPTKKKVERELTYRWRWLAWLRAEVASCIGSDVRVARWFEITPVH